MRVIDTCTMLRFYLQTGPRCLSRSANLSQDSIVHTNLCF